MAEVNLYGGGWRATLRPAEGGIMASLASGGTEVLRTMSAGARSPLDSAGFPLVPYANRVRGGRFAWHGSDVKLPHNFPPETSSIHGMGWQSAWRIAEQREDFCTLVHDHSCLGPLPLRTPIRQWPWAYRATQTVHLEPGGAAITLEVTNASDTPMPAGLGLHPYFRRRPETRITFHSNTIVLVGEDQIPTGETAEAALFGDFSAGAELPDQLIDHSFAGWDGHARIEDDLGSIELHTSGAKCLHVYAPPRADFLCLEPVTHLPDALNQRPDDMITLAPGQSAGLTLRITAGT
ncbi:aldose 1-epimerase [Allopontixanthobacter sediminis]|uniref:Aldose 1-epimerase n=1 Tax=Allopontixanthobacter sediminis TaxID=1689985 RepID=A0A845B178_9SPHN|nr:aldose 1-epimerase [Allopontixanthobacter sediminis]MXP43894.1 aldose 1-epimerase [Allopontixanthobacter sediminis]